MVGNKNQQSNNMNGVNKLAGMVAAANQNGNNGP